jgi:hypothetical protein
MRIDSSGNVGIGVSPSTILNIKSAQPILKLEDTTAYNSSPRNRIEFRNIFNADTVQHPAGYIDMFSSNSTAGNYETHMAFTTRTASSGLVEAMRIDSRQNVGIGVFSSLDHKLTIKTSAIGQDWIKGLQSDGGQGFRISADSGDDAVFELGSASTSDMVVLRADGNSHFYGGNVGIGTKSPDTLLHLTEAGGATLRITNSSDGASDETHIGTVEFEGHDGSTNRAGVMAKIVARYSDTGSGDAIDGSANEGGSLGFYTSIATTVGGAQTLAEKMRIENNGKVGIGTTSPSELLTISNSSDTNKTKLAIVGGTKGFTIGKTFQSQSYGHIRPISSGQVMALRLMPNTADQDTFLEIFGHDYETETTNFARGMLVLKQSDGNAFQIISDANGSESVGPIEFIIENGSEPAVVIDASGRMGIGTSSPSYPGLHISNSTPYLALEDSDGTNQKIDILHSGGGTFFTGRNGNAYGSFTFRAYNGTTFASALTIDSSQDSVFGGNVASDGFQIDSFRIIQKDFGSLSSGSPHLIGTANSNFQILLVQLKCGQITTVEVDM